MLFDLKLSHDAYHLFFLLVDLLFFPSNVESPSTAVAGGTEEAARGGTKQRAGCQARSRGAGVRGRAVAH